MRLNTDRFPQLRGVKVTHAWTGNVAFTFDALPHMGERDGLHYCLGCNGSGVAMMTYLGWQTARKIARAANYACSYDTEVFPDHPLYSGNPWFLPVVGGCSEISVIAPPSIGHLGARRRMPSGDR
jgi:FAD dependent oxidoreductase